jgi:hypothetical protein
MVFGNLQIRSPRLRCCPCSEGDKTKSFSPLAQVLPERSTPERFYVETLFASLLSYGATTKLLSELLPLDEQLNAVTIRNHLLEVAERSEAELEPEQVSFYRGMPGGLGGITDSQWPAHDWHRRRIRTRPTGQRMVRGYCRQECLGVPATDPSVACSKF